MFRRLADESRLQVRLWVMMRDDNELLARHLRQYRMVGFGKNHLTSSSFLMSE